MTLWKKVRVKFQYNLRKRHNAILDSKKGQIFEIDHISWTAYHNFDQMFVEVAKEIVAAGVAELSR